MASKKYAVGIDFGDMRPFPVCCSAKNLCSIGGRFTTGGGDKLAPNVQCQIPPNLRELTKSKAQQLMNRMPATLRAWPVRIWYSFLLAELYKKRVNGQGGGDGYRTKTFIVSDNVCGSRRWERGSGFALWCRNVPGVKVVRSGDYPGAHGGTCESYFITLHDVGKIKTYLDRSRKMLNSRLTKLRNSPERKRRGSNTATPRANTTGFQIERHW